MDFPPLPSEPETSDGELVELALDRRASLPGGAVGVALAGAELVTTSCSGGIWRRPRDGRPPAAVASDTFCPFTVAVDGTEIDDWDWIARPRATTAMRSGAWGARAATRG